MVKPLVVEYPMLALLDGDIFAYRCAASAENDPVEVALWRVDESIEQCLAATKASDYQVWLSDKKENNFRYAIYPDYKANRTQPKPVHLDAVKEHLIKNWNANIAFGQEADDALGIGQVKQLPEVIEFEDLLSYGTIICSIDKDLLMIPGRHYNFVKDEYMEVTRREGIAFFYKQLLIGDRADNVFGVAGIGPVKANKIIDRCVDELEMFARCLDFYSGNYDRLVMNGKVLWIRQKQDQQWEPPLDAEVLDEIWPGCINFCNKP